MSRGLCAIEHGVAHRELHALARGRDMERHRADQVAARDEQSAQRMDHHHRFAIAVTLLQVAIALSAIAALTRRRPPRFLGMAVGLGGLAMFGFGFL